MKIPLTRLLQRNYFCAVRVVMDAGVTCMVYEVRNPMLKRAARG